MLSRFSQDGLATAGYGPPPDQAALAAALAHGLPRNHPFADDNRRTAAVACETVIVLNDAAPLADDLGLYSVYIGLADGTIEAPAFADWLRPSL